MGLCYVPLLSWVTASYSMTLTTLPQCWSTCNLSCSITFGLNLVEMCMILMNLIMYNSCSGYCSHDDAIMPPQPIFCTETHEVDNPGLLFLVVQASDFWFLVFNADSVIRSSYHVSPVVARMLRFPSLVMYEMGWNREDVREAFPSIFTWLVATTRGLEVEMLTLQRCS